MVQVELRIHIYTHTHTHTHTRYYHQSRITQISRSVSCSLYIYIYIYINYEQKNSAIYLSYSALLKNVAYLQITNLSPVSHLAAVINVASLSSESFNCVCESRLGNGLRKR